MTLQELDVLTQRILEKPYSLSSNENLVANVDGEVYRLVFDEERASLYEFLFKAGGKTLQTAYDVGLVRSALLGRNSKKQLILQHERIPFQAYWYEWTWEMLCNAAISVLETQKRLFDIPKCWLYDPHIWNTTFHYTKPVFFDFGAIRLADFELSFWLRLFWFGGNYLQAWKEKFRLNPAETQDLISLSKFNSLDAQIEFIKNLPSRRFVQTEWITYDKKSFVHGDKRAWQGKHKAVRDLFAKTTGISTAFDIGANTGDFVNILLNLGVKEIVACDVDETSLEKLYCDAQKKQLPVTASLMDAFHSWNYFAGGTRLTHLDDWRMRRCIPSERFKCDLVLAVALMHHLCYWHRLSFTEVAKIISSYSKQYAIVEWIPFSDPHLEGRINRYGDNCDEYNRGEFLTAFRKEFPKSHVEAMSSTLLGREMFLFEK